MIYKHIALLSVLILLSCLNVFAQEKNAGAKRITALCNRVSEIKELPHYDESGVDEVFDELFKAGEAVVPCLIEKIADTKIMPDPRCPHITDETRVGDVAYFVLVSITKIKFDDFFPYEIKEKYKTEGVYAYHEYIERKGSRKQLQSNLREWFRQKQKS